MANEIYHRSNWGNAVNDKYWADVYEKYSATNKMYIRSDYYENSNETDKLMADIYPKPSILLTPTAYDNGSLHSVKPVQSFGSELVTNGTFDTNSNWILSSGSSIANGKLTIDALDGSYQYARQIINTIVGSTYKLEFDITEINNTGKLQLMYDAVVIGEVDYNTIGTYTLNFKSTNSSGTLEIKRFFPSNTNVSIDNVSIKEVIDADFDFTRGSSATRVNEKGLIEDVQILSGNLVQNGDFSQIGSEEISNGDFSQIGSELITNGDFSNNGTGWNFQLGWTFSNNQAHFENLGTSNRNLWQSPLVSGKFYKLTFEITSITSGYIINANSSITDDTQFSTVGIHTQYFKADNVNLYLKASSDANLSIDNVSVKEVGQDWNFNNWKLTNNNVLLVDTSGYVNQVNVFVVGKNYKISVDVKDYTSGDLRIDSNGQNLFTPSGSNTTATIFISNLDKTNLLLEGNFRGTITNISVKEVGQNWTFGTGWNMGDREAVSVNGGNYTDGLFQDNVFENGKKYRLSFDVTEITSGTVQARFHTADPISATSVGSYSAEGVANGTKLYFLGFSTFNGKVDNISAIEITEDTDLPRINYTNFDYEDVLGDELVTNGSFSDDSDWVLTGATINGGKVNVNSSSPVYIIQNNVATVGKLYKVELTVSNYVEGDLRLRYPFTISESEFTGNGTYVFYGTAEDARFELQGRFSGQTYNYSIDNVSVKEFTENVVVPYSGTGSLLLEPQRSNLLLQSNSFDTGWNKDDITLTSAQSGVYGSNDAWLIQQNTNSSRHNINKSVSSSGTHTFSIYAKAKELQYIQIASVQTADEYANFDLSDGSVGTVGSRFLDAKATSVGNGWYRLSVYTNNGSNSLYISLIQSKTDGWLQSFSGSNSTDGLYIQHAQVESNSYPTSIIETTTSQVTRLADVCNNAGSSDLINSEQGTLYAEVSALADDGTNRCISLSDGTVDDRVTILFSTSSNRIRAIVKSNGSTSFDKEYTVTSTLDYHKVAIKYKANDFALWIDGVERFIDTSGSAPIGLNQLMFDVGNAILNFYGNTKCVAVFEALDNDQLERLTGEGYESFNLLAQANNYTII
jgi:hypothetical protein